MDAELDKLYAGFQSWKSGEIDSWDLEEAIHKFHQGSSKKLFDTHNNVDADIIIAWALKRGIISKEKIAPALLERMIDIMTIYD